MITLWKEIKINYEDQFKNNQILKDKIKKKSEKELEDGILLQKKRKKKGLNSTG
jgi:hypothetical protein